MKDNSLISLTNLDKLLWDEPPLTKADLLEYYVAIAPIALKHWSNRVVTIQCYPNGIMHPGFYQKKCPGYAPNEIKTSGEQILINHIATLAWWGNHNAVEFNPSTYLVDTSEHPSFAIIDLDPTAPMGFEETVNVALKAKIILDEIGLHGYPKTSGATGIHIYIPLEPKYSFEQTCAFVEFIGKLLVKFYPELVTTERLIKNRHGIYVDHMQNAANKTIVGVYSPRPRPGAPVSAPVTWDELPQINPLDFTIKTVPQRVRSLGDLFEHVLNEQQTLEHVASYYSVSN